MQELCGQEGETAEVIQILQKDHVNFLFKEAYTLPEPGGVDLVGNSSFLLWISLWDAQTWWDGEEAPFLCTKQSRRHTTAIH